MQRLSVWLGNRFVTAAMSEAPLAGVGVAATVLGTAPAPAARVDAAGVAA